MGCLSAFLFLNFLFYLLSSHPHTLTHPLSHMAHTRAHFPSYTHPTRQGSSKSALTSMMDVDSSDEEGTHASLTKSEGAFLTMDKDIAVAGERERERERERDDRLSYSENSLDSQGMSGERAFF